MEQVTREIFSPSNRYKVEIIKRKDGLFTTEVYKDQIDYWSPIKQGLSLIQTEEEALSLAVEQLREYSGETITDSHKNKI